MNKTLLSLATLGLVVVAFSCADPNLQSPDQVAQPYSNGNLSGQRVCGAVEVLEQHLLADPSLAGRMQAVAQHTQNFIARRTGGASAQATQTAYTGLVTIPVAVHVIYNTAAQNISQAQIQSQIDALNQDFRKTNADVSKVPAAFAGVVTDMNVQFRLASVDRKSSTKTSWTTNDAMKKTATGGVNVISPSTTLNIWVCNLGGGILGYAQFPGDAAATDGVVITTRAFGTTGYLVAPYNKGRTATHEIGHWLNLSHIWGDANCGSDLVADTPTQQTSNGGCPAYPRKTCGNTTSGDMFMNYMDYTDDACMYMFSNGQKDRTRALFATGGSRRSFVTL
jgi:Pregnancy-associated plasma protein-A